MKILTEADLRSAMLPKGKQEHTVEEGTYVTPLAKEFLQDRGITLVYATRPTSARTGKKGWATMSRTPFPGKGGAVYVDAITGKRYTEKPEEMTHLRENILVAKTHPRIAFRGKLDSLQAKIMEIQVLAHEQGYPALVDHLAEVLCSAREILGAEVKETPLEEGKLFGLDQSELRRISHNTKQEIGIEHPVPDYTMGKVAVMLNSLRTQVRETELAAAKAFSLPGEAHRADILQALNRMSSGIYILFCRLLAGYYKGEHEE